MTAERGAGSEADLASKAALLTRSPRGLTVLARLCGEDLDRWSTSPPVSEAEVARVLGSGLRTWSARSEHDSFILEERGGEVLRDPEALAVEVVSSIDGLAWCADRSRLAHLVRHGEVFRTAAQELLAAPGSRWWSEDLHRDAQATLGAADAPPDLVALDAEQQRMLGELPWRLPQVLTTSRRLGRRLPAVRLGSAEAVVRWGDPVGVWKVSVDADARVYEVHGADDWRRLCTWYPRRAETPDDYRRWGVESDVAVAPDWSGVRREWDGVHVSLQGVLTAVGVPVDVDGAAGVLEDVDSELTTWFRPRLGAPVLIATVSWSDLP